MVIPFQKMEITLVSRHRVYRFRIGKNDRSLVKYSNSLALTIALLMLLSMVRTEIYDKYVLTGQMNEIRSQNRELESLVDELVEERNDCIPTIVHRR